MQATSGLAGEHSPVRREGDIMSWLSDRYSDDLFSFIDCGALKPVYDAEGALTGLEEGRPSTHFYVPETDDTGDNSDQ